MARVLSATKEFSFCAAHTLPGHDLCGRMHGHNYRVLVTFRCYMEPGVEKDMVVDFKKMKEKISPLVDSLDHSYLNDHIFFSSGMVMPTAENIARSLFIRIADIFAGEEGAFLSEVVVYETPTCYVRYAEE